MRAEAIERLFLKSGETVTAEHAAALKKAITVNSLSPGVGVRRRVLPFGTVLNYDGGRGGGFVSPYFRPSARPVGDGFEITWERGLIEGIEPTIGGRKISGDISGVPAFHVPRAKFGAGECLVYFRLELSSAWGVVKIEPFAAAETPATQPYIADKLALILFDDGSHWRALVSNQGHLAINRRAGGIAQHLFFSKF